MRIRRLLHYCPQQTPLLTFPSSGRRRGRWCCTARLVDVGATVSKCITNLVTETGGVPYATAGTVGAAARVVRFYARAGNLSDVEAANLSHVGTAVSVGVAQQITVAGWAGAHTCTARASLTAASEICLYARTISCGKIAMLVCIYIYILYGRAGRYKCSFYFSHDRACSV